LDIGAPVSTPKSTSGVDDPLLDLFRKRSELAPAAFQAELRKQRGPKAAVQKASV
jgi:hypothetical protein